MKKYTINECTDTLQKLREYMKLLNEQMEYTKYEIDQFKRRYRQAAGSSVDSQLLKSVEESIIYYTKEELNDANQE